MNNLTDKQAAIYAYIQRFWGKEDRLPTTREIQAEFKFASQTSAVLHYRALCKKGFLEKRGTHYRFARQ